MNESREQLKDLRSGDPLRSEASLGSDQAATEPRQSVQRAGAQFEALLAPEGDVGNVELVDLLDVQAVQSLMDDFHTLIPLPMAIIDLKGRVLVGVGWQEMCTQFHRQHPDTCRYCIESDTLLSAGVAQGEFKLYKCKNNMWDVATPILVGGKHLGNLFMGQFFFEGEAVDHELFRAQARQYGFNEADYLAALGRVPRLSRRTLDTAMGYFTKLADMLSKLSYSNIKLARALTERRRAEAALKIAHEQLETRVRERTAELKKANDRLDAERRRFKDVLDNLPAYLVLLSPDYRVPFANRFFEERFGKSEGRRCYEYLFNRTAPCDVCETYSVLKTGQPHRWEWIGPDRRNYDIFDFPFIDSDGSQLIMEVGLDITERKRAEEETRRYAEDLRQSNRELQHFAYVASHDLQEPLRTVSSFSQLLSKRYQGKLDADADDFITFIVEGAKRMQTLINDLLAFSRIGTRGNPFAPVDCAELLGLVQDNLEAAIAESGAVITHEALPTLLADPTQLAQVFQNLFSNAIKFRRPDEPPRIHVAAARQDKAWRLSVRDNGIGIEPQYFERIFVIFQRLHEREQYPGTGIGLAICKKIVERHGGRMWVESELGRGSIFHFTLPDATESHDETQMARPSQ